VVFKSPKVVDYRASVHDIANHLMDLMGDVKLREKMGSAGRKRVVEYYDYRVIGRKFIGLVSDKLGIK